MGAYAWYCFVSKICQQVAAEQNQQPIYFNTNRKKILFAHLHLIFILMCNKNQDMFEWIWWNYLNVDLLK